MCYEGVLFVMAGPLIFLVPLSTTKRLDSLDSSILGGLKDSEEFQRELGAVPFD